MTSQRPPKPLNNHDAAVIDEQRMRLSIFAKKIGGKAVRSCLLVSAIAITPTLLSAETVFKKTGADGTVEFSDTPSENSKSVEIETAPTYDLRTPSPNTWQSKPTNQSAGPNYTSLAITSPANDSTIRINSGSLTVTGQVLPQLQQGHQFILRSNGATIAGPQSSASFSLQGLGRGSHALSLSVVDKAGHVVISSPPVTVNLLRASVANRGR
jgi:hypothetical protein